MAAVVHALNFNTSLNTVGPFSTAAFTPAANDLLVAIISWDGTTGAITVTDSLGGTWSQIITGLRQASADLGAIFVRDSLAPASSMTVTAQNAVAGTGMNMDIARVSGMTRAGSSAVRQSGKVENTGAGTTPSVTFAGACLTGNPTIVAISNASNPAAITPPVSWTELSDLGHATPTRGQEYANRDSGFTGTTITWGALSPTAWGTLGIELDTSVAVGAFPFGRTDRRIVPLI
jgi:hypothetical protein